MEHSGLFGRQSELPTANTVISTFVTGCGRVRADGPPHERDFFNVKSLVLRGNTLAVGGRMEDPERTRKVMWLELSNDSVKIVKASDAILAREV